MKYCDCDVGKCEKHNRSVQGECILEYFKKMESKTEKIKVEPPKRLGNLEFIEGSKSSEIVCWESEYTSYTVIIFDRNAMGDYCFRSYGMRPVEREDDFELEELWTLLTQCLYYLRDIRDARENND